MQEVNELLEIANEDGLKSAFKTITLLVFWIKFVAENPNKEIEVAEEDKVVEE